MTADTPKTTNPFFARPALPGKRVRGFMSLPGELRNRVYGHYFAEEFRVEIAAKPIALEMRKCRTVKLCSNNTIPPQGPNVFKWPPRRKDRQVKKTLVMPRKLGRYQRVDGMKTKWETSLSALTLVSKQLYKETIMFLYGNTTFAFDAPKRINNFLATVPSVNLKYIAKLELSYSIYGEPSLAAVRIFRAKHVAAWYTACANLSKRLVNLQGLQIWIASHDNFGVFDLRGPWLAPFANFRRLAMHRKDASGALQPLTKLNVFFGCYTEYTRKINMHPLFKRWDREMNYAFGNAIAGRIISGWNDEDALADLRAAYKNWGRLHRIYPGSPDLVGDGAL